MAAILSSIGFSKSTNFRSPARNPTVRRIDGDKIGDERLAHGLHGRRIVPEMRIVAGLVADQRSDDDLLASGRLMGDSSLLIQGS